MELLSYISKGLFLSEEEAKRYIVTIPRRYKNILSLKEMVMDID